MFRIYVIALNIETCSSVWFDEILPREGGFALTRPTDYYGTDTFVIAAHFSPIYLILCDSFIFFYS
jgi:hypothetical protein